MRQRLQRIHICIGVSTKPIVIYCNSIILTNQALIEKYGKYLFTLLAIEKWPMITFPFHLWHCEKLVKCPFQHQISFGDRSQCHVTLFTDFSYASICNLGETKNRIFLLLKSQTILLLLCSKRKTNVSLFINSNIFRRVQSNPQT